MIARQQYSLSIVVTLVIHAALGTGLYAAGRYLDKPVVEEPIEIEIIEPPPRVEPPPPPPEPKIEPKTEPKTEPPPPEPRVAPPPRPQRTERAPEPPPEQPAPEQPAPEQPAPGPNTNNDAPAPVVKLENLTPGGQGPPVAVGRPTSRKVGTGGTGTNTSGGATEGTGTGGPAPVSIASIKTRAEPLNPDLDAGKLYPPEAKRLGVEGKIKVKLIVDERGSVIRTQLLNRLGSGLDELAVTLAATLRFKPAIDTNDRPVKSVVVWTFDFVLPE